MSSIKIVLTSFTLAICFSTCLTSCYRMPTEDDFSLVPTTNNPAVTCERNDSPIPSVGY
jgi:hypothetical protein